MNASFFRKLCRSDEKVYIVKYFKNIAFYITAIFTILKITQFKAKCG